MSEPIESSIPSRPTPAWFGQLLLLLILVGGVVRILGADGGAPCVLASGNEEVAAALAEGRCYSYNDAVAYRANAQLNVDGHWFDTFSSTGQRIPSALHAPLYTVVITPFVAAGIDDMDTLQRATGLLGCLTIALAGLVVRRLAGPQAGLLAAFLVAVHPLVWINDILLMPEGVYATVVLGVIALAYRFHDEPSWGRAAVLGGGLGVATLTRNEAAFAVALIALPLALGARGLTLRSRLERWAVMVAVLLAVLSPWVLYNTSRFGEPIFTNGAGSGMRSGTCDATFYNPDLLGLRSIDCLQEIELLSVPPTENPEVAGDRIFRSKALEYYGDNLGRTPAVVSARVGRFWSVYRPFQTVRLDDVIEQRGIDRSDAGIVLTWLLSPVAVVGAVWLLRRRVPLSPLLGWAGCATIVAASNTPLLRFRGAADMCIALLAAIGAWALWMHPARGRIAALASFGPAPTDTTLVRPTRHHPIPGPEPEPEPEPETVSG